MKHQTTAAACAKQIRKELKTLYPHVKFSITSDTFAGGNSINIKYADYYLTELNLRNVVDKYCYSDFNSMTDMHEYKRNIDNLLRVKYVSVERKISDTHKQKAEQFLMNYFGQWDTFSYHEKEDKKNRFYNGEFNNKINIAR